MHATAEPPAPSPELPADRSVDPERSDGVKLDVQGHLIAAPASRRAERDR